MSGTRRVVALWLRLVIAVAAGFGLASAAAAHPPYGLAVDREGNVYFSDLVPGDAPWLPNAAALVLGRLLVLEANADHHDTTNRVRLVEVNGGRSRVIAAPGAQQVAGARGTA